MANKISVYVLDAASQLSREVRGGNFFEDAFVGLMPKFESLPEPLLLTFMGTLRRITYIHHQIMNNPYWVGEFSITMTRAKGNSFGNIKATSVGHQRAIIDALNALWREMQNVDVHGFDIRYSFEASGHRIIGSHLPKIDLTRLMTDEGE